MDTEMIILLATIAVGLGLAGYKAYKKLMADGKITLDEVIDEVKALGDKAEEVKEAVEDIIEGEEESESEGEE